ncbi:ABC transporter substrate-binding protein [Subtercola boreus]|uniref:Sugar ABC transporter substrate-binding protein n=1 Tax=Subtercola boreus TaxID=120213 RepID=A0A3E0WFY6_9MICO|nr:sugar ABC transporter substrate-binding protein [Subtercola boreus]RFA23715.1 sugar ABC transporter substrate-binding protein [Subtercola boreus]RFA24106.1 sugar ABC transporter substrate-binding protein [Subtercola boreus]RFA29809.1 sugar ABC transporter substrate-binding protein [Subtercola boreus]
MSNVARNRKVRLAGVVLATTAVLLTSACSGSSSSTSADGKVTIEFSQWWGSELPDGDLQKIVDGFQAENPNVTVKLLTQPYSSLQDQTTTAGVSGTLADVVGLDGAWVNNLVKQGALDNLSTEMTSTNYDASQLSSQVQIDGSTYAIPVVNFVYPLFTNDDLLAQAGVTTPPATRSEFLTDAKAITEKTSAKGWILPLGTTNPNGVQNDVMSWLWASGGSMLKDGQPDLTNDGVKSAVDYVKSLYDAKVVADGTFTLQEPDKVTQFTNGQVGMMVDSLAHITTIRKANPDLKFSISAVPAADSYTGKRGIPFASWGIGVSDKSEHKAEAWKFVQYMMSKDVNANISSLAHGFPANSTATPDFTGSDPLYEEAFKIYQAGYPANEFVGLPTSDQLMRDFDTNFQKTLNGDGSVGDMLSSTQDSWKKAF